jgi:hypothetical protein
LGKTGTQSRRPAAAEDLPARVPVFDEAVAQVADDELDAADHLI